jgi:hypothetical protein
LHSFIRRALASVRSRLASDTCDNLADRASRILPRNLPCPDKRRTSRNRAVSPVPAFEFVLLFGELYLEILWQHRLQVLACPKGYLESTALRRKRPTDERRAKERLDASGAVAMAAVGFPSHFRSVFEVLIACHTTPPVSVRHRLSMTVDRAQGIVCRAEAQAELIERDTCPCACW